MSVKTGTPATSGGATQLEIPATTPTPAVAVDDELEDELVIMDGESDEEPTPAPAPAAPAPAAPAAAAPASAPAAPAEPAAVDPDDAADGIVEDGDFVRLPRRAFARLKERSKRAGAAAAAGAADAAAAEAGFPNLRQALTALRALTDRAPPPAAADPDDLESLLADDPETPPMTTRPRKLSDNVRARVKAIRDHHAQQLAAKDAEIERLKTEQKARDEAAAAERKAAERRAGLAAHGFEDADYAEVLYQKRLAEANGAPVDMATWATELKTSKPYLFKGAAPAAAASAPAAAQAPAPAAPAPAQVPVTTAPAAAPAPQQPPADGGAAPVRNARDMSKSEYQAALRAKGLSVSSNPGRR